VTREASAQQETLEKSSGTKTRPPCPQKPSSEQKIKTNTYRKRWETPLGEKMNSPISKEIRNQRKVVKK
jgi:hypothetical protein